MRYITDTQYLQNIANAIRAKKEEIDSAYGIKDLVVSHQPDIVVVPDGITYSTNNLVITAKYNGMADRNVTNECKLTPVPGTVLSPESQTTITATYKYKFSTKSVTFNVGENLSPTSIVVLNPPDKIEYPYGNGFTGDFFDPTGLKIGAVFNSTYIGEYTKELNDDEYSLSISTNEKITTNKTLTITYGNLSTTLQLYINTPVFGAEWDGMSAPVLVRTENAAGLEDPIPALDNGTGSSPFDNFYPWKGMYKIEDVNAGTLIGIPKFYYKIIQDGLGIKFQISQTYKNGFLCSPFHMDKGDGIGERDWVYIGRYHNSSNHKSETGIMPYLQTITNTRTNIHTLGSDVWNSDYAARITLWLLYIIEFANWDSQATIGYGCGNGSSYSNNGLTDDMQYHTGTDKSTRTTYGHTQFRYIEDLWGNGQDWLDGIYFDGTNVYIKKNPADFNVSGTGTIIGKRQTSSGNIASWSIPEIDGYEYFIFPNRLGGNYTIPDYYSYSSTSTYTLLVTGSTYSQSTSVGLFNLYAYSNSGTSTSRLMKLPNNVKQLVSIEVVSCPTKRDYQVGEQINKAGMVVRATYTDGSTATVTNNCTVTLDVNKAIISYQYNTFICKDSFDVNIYSGATKIVTWQDGTNEEISSMVSAAMNGDIDLTEFWNVGDERKVHLKAMSATGVGESHVEQDVTFILMDANNEHYTYTSTPASGRTHPFFIVGQKNGLRGISETTAGEGYMSNTSSTASWAASPRRTWCNNIYKNAIDTNLVNIFHQVTYKMPDAYNSTTLSEISDYFFLPTIKEVYGGATATSAGSSSTKNSNLAEFNEYSQWQYYSEYTWHPIYFYDGTTGYSSAFTRSKYYSSASYFCVINTSTSSTYSSNTAARTLIPAGAI